MLRKEQWLWLAERLAVGESARVQHGYEGRKNLVIKNLPDRYVAYCQSCKEGSVHMKEHVLVGQPVGQPESTVIPDDMQPALSWDIPTQAGVGGFLATKAMDLTMLPPGVQYSRSRRRIMLPVPVQASYSWLGRDVTGKSQQKWMHFGDVPAIMSTKRDHKRVAFVVEDPFSYYKLVYSLEHADPALAARLAGIHVFCSLGTTFSDALVLELLEFQCVRVFYDGDKAGYIGATRESKRMRAMGVPSANSCAPQGMDPKDLTCEELVRSVCAVAAL